MDYLDAELSEPLDGDHAAPELEADEPEITSISIVHQRAFFQAVQWEWIEQGLLATGWWGHAIGNGDPRTVLFVGPLSVEYHSDTVTR